VVLLATADLAQYLDAAVDRPPAASATDEARMDELFELLTLQQTSKAPPAPIVLFGDAYWRRIVNFDALLEEGMVSPSDIKLFEYAETAEEGWASLTRRGLKAHTPNNQRPPP
jgi:hypothetical protein